MAAAFSVLQGKNDPLLLILSHPAKRLHALHHRHRHPYRRPTLIEQSAAKVGSWIDQPGGGTRRLGGRCVNGLTLKGCFDGPDNLRKRVENHHSHHCRRNNAFPKAPAFPPCPSQLFRDSEFGLEDAQEAPSRLVNGHGEANHTGSLGGGRDQTLPERVVVAVDVDEVLGNFVSALNRFIADRYSLNHSVSEYHVYEFFKIWNCSRDEANTRVHEFFKTSYFKTGIHPIPGSQRALQNMSRFCDLAVVTSRQNVIKGPTIEWIRKHYPGLFQGIHFGNHFALEGQSRRKSDICRSLAAKVLIDDNPRYAIECAEVGIRVLLFDYENSYPWCKVESVNQHPLITKVYNWEEVERHLVSWIFSPQL